MSEHPAVPSRVVWPVDRGVVWAVHDLVVVARYAGRRPPARSWHDRWWDFRATMRRIGRRVVIPG